MKLKLDCRIFAYGGVGPRSLASLLDEVSLWARTPDLAFRVGPVSSSDIAKARSKILSAALRSGSRADVLLMLDHDHVWAPGVALELCRRAVRLQELVSPAYAKRGLDGFAMDPVNDDSMTLGEDRYLEAAGLGCGMLAIPLKRAAALAPVLQEHADPRIHVREFQDLDSDFRWIDFFRPGPVPRADAEFYAGEDFAFTTRWRAAGGKALVWTLPRIGHVGDRVIWPEDCAPVVEDAPKKA